MDKKKKTIITVIAIILVIAIIVAVCIGVNNTMKSNAVKEFQEAYQKVSDKYSALAPKISAYSEILDSTIASTYTEAGNTIADLGIELSQNVDKMKTDEVKEKTKQCNDKYDALEKLEASFTNVESALQQ